MEKRNTFAVSFYCRESKVNKLGYAPIEMSISIRCKRVMVTLPRKEQPSVYDKAISSKRGNDIKNYIAQWYADVNKAADAVRSDGKELTADTVKSYLLGDNEKIYTIEELCRDYLKEVHIKEANGEISSDTWLKYNNAVKFLKEVCEITSDADAVGFEIVNSWQRSLMGRYKESTAYHYLSRIKTMFLYAYNCGKISHNPFVKIIIKKKQDEITTINDGEYNRILKRHFSIDRLERVRLLFILACNCGLAFSDLINLKREDFIIEDNNYIINKRRIKTDVEYFSYVLDDGLQILKAIDYDMSVLRISNQKYNSYLKEVADLCGVSVSLHSHLARHFYISKLVRLGVPLSIVQKCAGHASQSMTLRYTHLHALDIAKAVSAKL